MNFLSHLAVYQNISWIFLQLRWARKWARACSRWQYTLQRIGCKNSNSIFKYLFEQNLLWYQIIISFFLQLVISIAANYFVINPNDAGNLDTHAAGLRLGQVDQPCTRQIKHFDWKVWQFTKTWANFLEILMFSQIQIFHVHLSV